jgi:hypothetical protein
LLGAGLQDRRWGGLVRERNMKNRWAQFGGGILFAVCVLATIPAVSASLDQKKSGYESFVIELPASQADVLKAVREVADDDTIHGTLEYEKDPILSGAETANSSDYFGKWTGAGTVLYKVRTKTLAPRHFKDSNDVGTITIRYVVQGLNEKNTRLQIDAIFVEDGRRKPHASDGTVETSEFKEIQDYLMAVQLEERKAAEAVRLREAQERVKATLPDTREAAIARLDSAQAEIRTLQARIRELQHDLEVRVKENGADLKSAPFQKSSTIESLNAKTDVVVLIITEHWYGIETADGKRGWIYQDNVEPLP